MLSKKPLIFVLIGLGFLLLIFLISVIIVNSSLYISFPGFASDTSRSASINVQGDMGAANYKLLSQKDNHKSVEVEVRPIAFNFFNEAKFNVKFTTHSVPIDFDLTKKAILEDNAGNKYKPLRWEGGFLEGNNRSGVLVFPKVKEGAMFIVLTFLDISNVKEIRFQWEL